MCEISTINKKNSNMQHIYVNEICEMNAQTYKVGNKKQPNY